MTCLCIDIGGTNTLIGIANGEFDAVKSIDTDRFLETPAALIEQMIDAAGYDRHDFNRTGVAVAGPLDKTTGAFYPPNLDADRVDITESLSRFGETIQFMNDCNAAVLGEHAYGGHGTDDLVYVTISTGIGAGVVMNGELIGDHRSAVAEVGHMVVDNQGVACGCGGTDHWEAYCSGKRLPQVAHTLFDADFTDSRAIFKAYREGDGAARDMVELMQQHNAAAFATIANAYSPEKIVVGGGVALNHADIILDGLETAVAEQAIVEPPSIALSSLKERTVLHGLRSLCR